MLRNPCPVMCRWSRSRSGVAPPRRRAEAPRYFSREPPANNQICLPDWQPAYNVPRVETERPIARRGHPAVKGLTPAELAADSRRRHPKTHSTDDPKIIAALKVMHNMPECQKDHVVKALMRLRNRRGEIGGPR